ncbi:hypothetical protein SK128_000907 [Halocaridina rubra]|uniref:Uncharacterized protein n=1 Tax=Halocaridina rubra TaxID=373956 RepID=A0AAN8X4T8_HALRR
MEDVHRTKLPILDAEAQAAQLNSALPISVTAENLEKHPNMSKLLEDLTHRLTPTGMRKETHAKFIQAKHSMHHARQKYLEEATFYRLIQDVLYWNTPDGKQGSTHRMAEALTLSELQDHLQLLKCGGSDSTSCDDIHKENFESSRCDTQQYAFGLNPEVVVARSKACVSDKGIRDTASAIEEHLENEWTRIASFRDPVGFVSYDPDEVAKIPKELEQKSRAVAAEKNKLIQSVLQNDYLFLQTLEQLIEYGSLLRNLMVSKRLCHYTHEHTDSLMTQMSALLLKLK